MTPLHVFALGVCAEVAPAVLIQYD